MKRFIKFSLLPSFLLRLILIVYSVYHDRNHKLKYTDVDYQVYSDAAKFILSSSSSRIGSPYDRDTYRYTPLLAILLLPNHLLHPLWGKVLFSLSDLVIGLILYLLIRSKKSSHSILIINSLWLLNPIVANISTRGSSESILGVLVISTLYFFERKRFITSAILLGLAVHFKIYPFIYGASIWSHLGSHSNVTSFGYRWVSINQPQFQFVFIAIGTLFGSSALMYLIWGDEYLQNSYLYHLNRLDHRHNFSPYFYQIYLNFFNSNPIYVLRFLSNPLISFLPQISLSLGLGFLFGSIDLRFAWFIQTLGFVGFNKVVTSQYFLWYLWFIPLILDRIHLSRSRLIFMVSSWIITQALWLNQAYQLEFMGKSVFRELWMFSLFFFICNSWILVCLIKAYKPIAHSNLKID
ncbi:family 50 glycosyltransferase [Melampsora larici-populina 98AG31]|uniref:GPI mannosyltransferase 1 n=1 Tax=Melampsora larici-populina (strain 98AG31 / pathotype 3-4-7) TaxID=747676 RepID=F4S1Z5_MELLP|nr:family 50 glycosyltransferase [Melampsora larici-populina 98AG31]EGG01354.1 family 50 glycosyltransferase [Melampsora larici-populina 98AG31]